MQLFFEEAFFPWGGLPYPYEQARLGLELLDSGKRAEAAELVPFLQAALDHRQRPIPSLFRQEKGLTNSELEEVVAAFFKRLSIQPEPSHQFIDSDLGILAHREEDLTVVSLASGCKSGMGAYMVGDAGILNYGPQLRPLGDCRGFGLAGRGGKISVSDESLSYQCRLAAPLERNTGIAWLEDSGFSGMWMESHTHRKPDQLRVTCRFDGYRPLSDFLFSFFLKGEAVYVAGSHKLSPRSLDRYRGPPQVIEMNGVHLIPQEGFYSMGVVPLAGDESFWGADFMVALELSPQSTQSFVFQRLPSTS